MDLVTLIAACALSVDPKSLPSGPDPRVMHALIWEQSGGEPWSISVPGETRPRVYSTLQDAIREALETRSDSGRIRIGLTGLATEPRSATAAMFAPCPNITFADQQITQFARRCKAVPRFKTDPIYSAIAAYRGSWERPDTKFADAVRATVEKGNAPNLDMPKDAYFDANDVASDTLTSDPRRGPTAPAVTSHDRDRGWSGALFPAKSMAPDDPSADVPKRGEPAEESHSTGDGGAPRTTAKLPADSLFVPRSMERRSQ